MTLYSDINSIWQNPVIRAQVRVAIAITAQFVLDAGSTNPTIMQSARSAGFSPDGCVDKFIWYVGRNITSLTPTDAEVQTIVDAKRDQIFANS